MHARKEERFYVPCSMIEEFIDKLDSFAYEKVFESCFNRTLYFNNVEHEVPFDVSIKARSYDYSSVGTSFTLDPSLEWIFEIKSDMVLDESRLRCKERTNLKLEEIIESLRGKFGVTLPLKPYVADDYRRRHFLVRGKDDFRVTIDDKINYYFFESGLNAKHIGSEGYSRVEVKIPVNKLESYVALYIKKLLQEFGALPIISKKDMAYNKLANYLRKRSNRFVSPSDVEIEAKLLLNGKDQQVFHNIKRDFRNGFFDNFKLLDKFPYTLEGGKLHIYLPTAGSDTLRVSLKGDSKSVVLKKDPLIINDPFGLNCIIKRYELKMPWSSDILDSMMLYRKRKYFIVENTKSRNTYCILVDRCTHEGHELFQIEIEGLLLSSLDANEDAIINDIAYIANKLVGKYSFLKPTTLTKYEWLSKFFKS